MHTWKSHLRFVLFRLARTHGNNTIADVERLLCEIFDAATARFVDLEDRPLNPDLQLQDVLQRPCRVMLNVEFQPQRFTEPDGLQRVPEPATDTVSASRFQMDASLSPADRITWFIREFDRLEQTHDFMWAGYIVKEMLSRIGLPPAEARTLLDELNAAGIVSVRKVPNPKNPDHPASAVSLMREHEQVQAILGRPTVREHAPSSTADPVDD
jgi:hypothetical protein